MKIAFVTPEHPAAAGGIGTYHRHLAAALTRAGHEVAIVVASPFSVEPGPVPPGVTVNIAAGPAVDARARGFGTWAGLATLQRHLAAGQAALEALRALPRPDVVEVADWGLLAPAVLAGTELPVVVQLHGSIGQITRRERLPGEHVVRGVAGLLEDTWFALASARQSYAAANAAEWRGRLGQPVELIRPAFAPPVSAVAAGSGEGFLVAGRLQPWKGPDVLCRALERLGAKAPVVHWIGRITRDPETGLPMDAALARRHPAVFGHALRSEPVMRPGELAQRLAATRVVIVPSDWDVFNFTAVEAMAAGKVLIVSTGAGAAELVRDGENGLLFPAGDDAALAACLARAAALAPAEAAALGAAAQTTAARELDPDRIAATRVAAWQAAVSPPRPPAPAGLVEAILPEPGRADDLDGWLGGLPLSLLARHATRRVKGKLGGHG